jgi:hypothetical protein
MVATAIVLIMYFIVVVVVVVVFVVMVFGFVRGKEFILRFLCRTQTR